MLLPSVRPGARMEGEPLKYESKVSKKDSNQIIKQLYTYILSKKNWFGGCLYTLYGDLM